jgi:hypothetical protein
MALLTYTTKGKTINIGGIEYMEPSEGSVQDFVNPHVDYTLGGNTFPTISSFTDFVNGYLGQNQGINGIYASTPKDILGNFYQADKGITVIQSR